MVLRRWLFARSGPSNRKMDRHGAVYQWRKVKVRRA